MLKKLLVIVVALIGIAAVLLAVRVLPAHLQIRNVEIELPTLRQIEAVLDRSPSEEHPVDVRFVNTASQSGGGVMISHPGVLVRWADGRMFLVDAGMNREQVREFGRVLELVLGADPAEPYGPIEEQMGADVAGIRGIGFTHLHSDHTGGVTALCETLDGDARIFQTVHQASLHNSLTEAGQALIDGSGCRKQVLGDELVKPVPGFPGIVAIAAGGHTPGSTIFAIRSGGMIRLFAGDITNSMADLRANRGKGWIYSYVLVPENEGLLARWRTWLGTLLDRDGLAVVVAHDLDSYRAAGLTAWHPAPAGVSGIKAASKN